jgi:hypothetical protein
MESKPVCSFDALYPTLMPNENCPKVTPAEKKRMANRSTIFFMAIGLKDDWKGFSNVQ